MVFPSHLESNELLNFQNQTIAYKVQFSGIDDKKLEKLLHATSQSEKRIQSPPESRFILERRAKRDENLLEEALQSRGYFSAQVHSTIDFSDSPAQLTFHVKLGPNYTLQRLSIRTTPEESGFEVPTLIQLGLQLNETAISRTILTGEKRLLKEAKKQGFAFAKLKKRHTLLDHNTKTLDVTLSLDVGHKVTLGSISMEGIEGIDKDYLAARIPWKSGTLYHPQLLENGRRAIVSTGLFSIVRIQLEPQVEEEKQLAVTIKKEKQLPATLKKEYRHPITLKMLQRKHRLITTGLGFNTGQGIKIAAGWENRNFFSGGEMVRSELELSLEKLYLKGLFAKPDFLKLHQKLITSITLDQEDTDAFFKKSLSLDGELNRPVGRKADISYGLAYRLVNLEDKSAQTKESFGLFSIPVKLTLDKRNDILDATEGWRFQVAAKAAMDTLGTGVWFGKITTSQSLYHPLFKEPRLTAAGRINLGVISGSARQEIPADERFFVGGGGSLRGFGFQMAGSIDEENNPLGGRSLFEFAFETRLRITKTIGLVLFLDGGRAYESSMLDFSEEMFFGTGLGFRYITPIGPFRMDIGTPLNGRDEVDDLFQLYLSIGQAF